MAAAAPVRPDHASGSPCGGLIATGASSIPIRPIDPGEIRIEAVVALPRTIHQDPRGFLVETLRADDRTVDGSNFVMSYSSVTIPGEARDRDRWHVHRNQTDRFVVPLGEMLLALFDGRAGSPTHGRLEVIRLAGTSSDGAATSGKHDLITHLVTIPPGVYHCIANRSSQPFLLQNYPTQYYTLDDEGRVPFAEVEIPALKRPFRWDLVEGTVIRPTHA